MIAFLKGVLSDKTAPKLVLDVNGVGYEVEVSLATFAAMPDLNETVLLHTQMIVREDAQLLYGFYERAEKTMFQTLIKVNGVGAKMALAILSSMSANEFVNAVHNNDTLLLVKIPGVGKKTAERLIVEMKDKVTIFDNLIGTAVNYNSNEQEAVSALEALGYKSLEANKRVKNVIALANEKLSVADMIKEALR